MSHTVCECLLWCDIVLLVCSICLTSWVVYLMGSLHFPLWLQASMVLIFYMNHCCSSYRNRILLQVSFSIYFIMLHNCLITMNVLSGQCYSLLLLALPCFALPALLLVYLALGTCILLLLFLTIWSTPQHFYFVPFQFTKLEGFYCLIFFFMLCLCDSLLVSYIFSYWNVLCFGYLLSIENIFYFICVGVQWWVSI